jgi:cell division transport system permease protein
VRGTDWRRASLALGVVVACAIALQPPLRALADSYGSGFALGGLDPLRAVLVRARSRCHRLAGAWLVTGHFLRQTRPTET